VIVDRRSIEPMSAVVPGCVKTLTLKLSVEILSAFRRSKNQSHWQPLSGEAIEKTILRILR
jgi:hypothetical protein